jgi:hypothetical protein
LTHEIPCPKCRTRNPDTATQCLFCGAPLTLTPSPEPRPLALGPRLLASLAAGSLILLIVIAVSYQQYCGSAIRYDQRLTLESIARVVDALQDYQGERHTLPKTLDELPNLQLVRTDDQSRPADYWRRPLQYQVNGSRYRVFSSGRDGKPGGLGLDYDLSNDDLTETKDRDDSARWRTLPAKARPTFRQFLSDRGGSVNSGSGQAMALASLISGLTAFLLAFLILGAPPKAKGRSVSVAFELLIALGGTLLVGLSIAVLHVPSGH